MKDYSSDQVAFALRNLGAYRVRRAQTVALQGEPDQISGATLLALGLRETGLRNVNGGARLENGVYVPTKDDRGIFQISSEYHMADLALMPGVKEGTWGPVVRSNAKGEDVSPRFEDALQFTLREMHEAQAYALDHGIDQDELGRFAVVSHNAGIGGALRGFKDGNPDKFTAGGDYSEWVERHRTKVNQWLKAHPNWRIT